MEIPQDRNGVIQELSGSTEQKRIWENSSRIFLRLANLSLGATIICAPFRLRFYQESRPLPPVFGDYTDFILFAGDVFLLLTLFCWLLSLFGSQKKIHTGPFFLSIPIAGLGLSALLGIPFSVDPALSIYHVIRLLALAGLALYLSNTQTSLKKILLPVCLMIFIQASVGVAQVLEQHSLGLSSLGEYALDPAWPGVSIVSHTTGRLLRAYGISDHPNILGGCFAFGLSLILVAYPRARPRWRPALTAVFLIGLLGLLVTFSRSAWLGFIVAIIVAVTLAFSSRQKWLLAGLAALLFSGLIALSPFLWHYSPFIFTRLNRDKTFQQIPEEKKSLEERGVLIRATNQIFSENALTGIGLGALPVAMKMYYPEFPYDYQPAHVVLLSAAAETGIFGSLFAFLALAAPWLALWIARKKLRFSLELIAASALLASITVVGLFDYYPWLLVPGRLWQFLAWGLWAAAYRNAVHGS